MFASSARFRCATGAGDRFPGSRRLARPTRRSSRRSVSTAAGWRPTPLVLTLRALPQHRTGPSGSATNPVVGALPELAARRQLNRGFEGLALSDDAAWLYLAFQSPLAHPDEGAHKDARHVRIWKLDVASGKVAAQFLYPLDRPRSFLRDVAQGHVHRSDIKISELVPIGDERLIVLERASATTKLYLVQLDPKRALASEHLDVATRPSVEELSGQDRSLPDLPTLAKTLILTTDDLPDVDPDLEGLIVLSPTTLLLVNDNDFGVEDVRTRFWRIDLPFSLDDDLAGRAPS
jgi:hypothetical protein